MIQELQDLALCASSVELVLLGHGDLVHDLHGEEEAGTCAQGSGG
jgi:hypothetical protein